MAKLKPIWRDRNINLNTKLKLLRFLIMSIFLYAYETWTLTEDLQRKIQAVEMRCFRQILGISYLDYITNEEVLSNIRQSTDSFEDLLTTVKKRKLKWYGHVTRADGLSKTILQGTVPGSLEEEETGRRRNGPITSRSGCIKVLRKHRP